jgi:2'-5' RNA ligase
VSEERARLFAALELPAVARRTLAHWSSVELGDLAQARRLDPDSFHLTLCFLGSHAVTEVPAIARACRAVGVKRRVVLTLGASRRLPARAPRAIAVEVVEGDGELSRLQAALSRALQDGGWYQPERHRFLAHITVARLAKGAPEPKTELAAPTPLRFVSDAVTLYRSYTDADGARYQPLETVGLSG